MTEQGLSITYQANSVRVNSHFENLRFLHKKVCDGKSSPCRCARFEVTQPSESKESSGHVMSDYPNTRPRRSLRDIVCDIDKDILKLLLRRHNLIKRMHNEKGYMDSAEEKTLRASWQTAVARISKDARLSSHFFSLMQDVEFLPRPAPARNDAPPDDGDEAALAAAACAQREEARRQAFNLAPAQKPARLVMRAPFACRTTRAWLMLAAATGCPVHLAPCLMNDPIVDFLKALNQAGASLTREDDGVTARKTDPLGAPDKVLHVGDSAWNFFLLLAHYLGRPSRAKFSGETALKLADFSATRRFLPALGARLAPVVPKSDGLPVRVECSGLLPDVAALPADAPPELAEAVLLAAPLYAKPLTLDLAAHPRQALILARVLPILREVGARVTVENAAAHVVPGPLCLPALPALPLEPELANFVLALPLVLGGEARLAGVWPQWPGADAALKLLQSLGLALSGNNGEIYVRAKPLQNACLEKLPEDFPAEWTPLLTALAACATLRGGNGRLPEALGRDASVEGFLRAAGLEITADGRTRKLERSDLTEPSEPGESNGTPVWNAPAPAWALALALAACVNPHLKLGNPGCVTELYPAFWSLYNALPEPAARLAHRENPTDDARPSNRNRRIRAD
jgi:5-enolpyruvylshikimate-3-phosphate synthase